MLTVPVFLFFQIITLPNSKFYHIGTMSEYLDALCGDDQLAAELSFGMKTVESYFDSEYNSGVVMCSVLNEAVHVPANVVLEFCKEQYSMKFGLML